jgi:hypothetical protein
MTAALPARWPDADVALLSEIYDLQCTSRMNTLYYDSRLARVMTISFWMEVATAAAASGSGLLAVLNDAGGWGHVAWQALALIAALVAVIKPIYAPSKKIELFTRQQQGYHTNYFSLKKLAFNIRQEGTVSEEHRRHFSTVFDRHVQLSTEDENSPNRKLLTLAQERTARELPPDSFWWPPATAMAEPEPTHAGETAGSATPAGVIQLKTS